jgi:tetratricopeptide (TPR) repeat protein
MRNSVHAFLVYILFVALAVLFMILALNYPLGYIWITYEDLLGEWAQFYLFLFALLFSVRHLLKTTRYRVFFGLLSLACFYVIMEEISWGQRLFGWESSEFFKTRNLQGETNLHNMLTGPYSTMLKDTMEYALAVLLVLYGLIYPFALKLKWSPAKWLDSKNIPAPPLYLWPFFLTGAYLELGMLSFNEAEIAEILIGLAMAVMALHYLHASQFTLDYQHDPAWDAQMSKRLTLRIAHTVFLVVLMSVATTFCIYATEAGRKRADNRIESGIKKFSGRYERYENWDMVVYLDELLLKRKPKSRSLLRDLANAHRHLGDEEKSHYYLEKALFIDLRRLEKEPWRASTNQSLVRTYRLMGDSKNSEFYLQKALQIGLARIKKNPESADALYSLGRTYELMGEKNEVKRLFEKAYKLRPTSKKFRKAYYKLSDLRADS